MSSPDRLVLGALPEPVLQTLEHFEDAFGAVLRIIVPPEPGGAAEVLYQTDGFDHSDGPAPCTSPIVPHLGPELELQVLSADRAPVDAVSATSSSRSDAGPIASASGVRAAAVTIRR